METVSKEDFWQIILNDSSQFGQITTEDEDFNKLANYTWLVLQNTFVISEDENYLKSFEEMVDVDNEGLSIIERKANVLFLLSEKKYVPRNLIKKGLERLGIDRCEIEYDRENNKMSIVTEAYDKETLANVNSLFRSLVSDEIQLDYDTLGFVQDGWKKVEYLESTGSNYINVYVTLNTAQSTIEIITRHLGTALSNLGDNSPQTEGAYGLRLGAIKKSGKLCPYVDKGGYAGVSTKDEGFIEGEWYNHHVIIDKNKVTFVLSDGTQKDVAATQTPNEGYWRLFTYGTPYKGKKSSFVIKVNGITKYDMIPAIDPTGAPCMYNRIDKKAYYNSGQGDLIAPSENTAYAFRRVLPDWGKLTEYGLRRLYYTPADYEGELIEYALEHDYKQIIETEKPEEGYWTPQWRETEDEIILDWIETEEPTTEQ